MKTSHNSSQSRRSLFLGLFTATLCALMPYGVSSMAYARQGEPSSDQATHAATAEATAVDTSPAVTEPADGTNQSAEPAPTATSSAPTAQPPEKPVITEAPATNTSQQQTAISQQVESTSTSGSAAVKDSNGPATAASGQASAQTTVVNVVNGNTGGLSSAAPVTFVQDITGDVQGTLTIDPASLTGLPTGSVNVNLAQQTSSGVSITNDIDLQAVSGQASATGNNGPASATSGDATALANVINIVSSSLGAKRSFVGVINIHGNLTGDIVVPKSFVDSLLASNTSPGQPTSTTDMTDLPNGSVTSNIKIANNVELSARSGDALASNNAGVSSARSGDARTNLIVFNLTAQHVIAKNSLLVFVNVLGEWVGMIVPAPSGSTAVAFSGGLAEHSSVSGQHLQDLSITNNIRVNATSGEAIASDNDSPASATSGSAGAGANVLNLVHSSLNFDDWFGAIFINVLGSWLGDFDLLDDSSPQQGTVNSSQTAVPAVQAVRVFTFNADTPLVQATPEQPVQSRAATMALESQTTPGVSATQAVTTVQTQQPAPARQPSQDSSPSPVLIIAGLAIATTLIIGGSVGYRRYA